jgi:DNA-directed RNA polymerase specialized sigma24 family protein
MQSLYLLAFLLTANHADAEECFVAGMEHAGNERTVFKEWARSWSRRILIKTTIRMITPVSAQSHARPDHWAKTSDESEACMTINAVAQLASLDRIVFVMSVLERYSVRECAALLDCSARDVQRAQMRALQQLPALYLALLSASSEEHNCVTERLQREYERSQI